MPRAVDISLTGFHCKFRRSTEGMVGANPINHDHEPLSHAAEWAEGTVGANPIDHDHELCHTPLNGLKVRWGPTQSTMINTARCLVLALECGVSNNA
jgi:hypothetical protein